LAGLSLAEARSPQEALHAALDAEQDEDPEDEQSDA